MPVLLDRGGTGELERIQRGHDSREIHHTFSDRTEDPRGDRGPKIPPLGPGSIQDSPIDILEVHVIDAITKAAYSLDRIDAGIRKMSGVQAHPEALVIDVCEQLVDFVEELNIGARMLMEHGTQLVLGGNVADPSNPIQVANAISRC